MANQAPSVLYACRDNFAPQKKYQATTILGTPTLVPQGTVITLTTNVNFEPSGDVIAMIVGTNGAGYWGRVVKQIAGNQVLFLPLFDPFLQNADGVQLVNAGNAATFRWLGIMPLELDIDLSQAGDKTYKYLILTQASVWNTAIGTGTDLSVFTNARPGQPYFPGLGAGAADRRGRVLRATTGFPELFNYFSAHSLSILGGDTRSVFFEARWPYPSGPPPGAILIAEHTRITALRVDECTWFMEGVCSAITNAVGLACTGAQSSVTANASDEVCRITIPADGDYTIVASGALGATPSLVNTANCELRLTPLVGAPVTLTVGSTTSDNFPYGVVTHRVGLKAGDVLQLLLGRTAGAGTAHLDHFYLCAFTKPPYVEQVATADPQAVVFQPAHAHFSEVMNQGQTITNGGRCLEFISFAPTGANLHEMRPRFGAESSGPTTGIYAGDYRARGGGQQWLAGQTNAMCFFHRTRRAGGTAATNYIDAARLQEGTAANGVLVYQHFVWFKLADSQPRLDQSCVFAARVEYALYLKAWLGTAVVDVYRYHVGAGKRVSRVLWAQNNAVVSLTRVYSAWVPSAYFLDEAAGDVYIYLAPGVNPGTTPGQVVMVCLWMHVATRPLELIESDGNSQPYEPRLKGPPRITQAVKFAAGTGDTSSSTLGEMTLIASDAAYDPVVRQRRFDGMRFEVFYGVPQAEDKANERDMAVYARGVCGGVKLDRNELKLPLYSALVTLSGPVTEAKMTVNQGSAGVGVNMEILAPRCFGYLSRVPAYRQTNTTTGGDSTYKISDWPVAQIGAIYLDGETNLAVVAGQIASRTATTASFVIHNAAFSDPANPPDVIYAQVWGHGIAPSTPGSRWVQYPGEVCRMALTMVGFPASQINEASFADFDRLGRRRLTGTTKVPAPPVIGVYVDQTISVKDLLNKITASVGGFRFETLGGRVGISVPDFKYQQLATNPGFEADASSPWPWESWNGALLTVSGAPTVYGDGAHALELANTNPPSTSAFAGQTVVVRNPGRVLALTPVVAAKSGVTTAVRIGILRPSDGLTMAMSDPVSVTSTAWRRMVAFLQLDEDEAGSVLVGVFPAYGTSESTAVVVDDAEVWPVSVLSRGDRLDLVMSELDEQFYYAAAVGVAQNTQSGSNPVAFLTDGDLKGVGWSLAKFALPGSGQVSPGDTIAYDLASAAGVAGALLDYFATPRHSVQATVELPSGALMPLVGDILLDDTDGRKAASPDGMPIYVVREVQLGVRDTAITVTAETQTPLVSDSGDLAPGDVPMGMILWSTDGQCPADYTEYTAPKDYFIACLAPGELAGTIVGGWTHSHSATHRHNLSAHTHNVNGLSLGASDADQTRYYDFHMGQMVLVSRGPSVGDHIHPPAAGGPFATGGTAHGGVAQTVESSDPNAPLNLTPGSNLPPSLIRLKLCKRIGSAAQLPTNLAFHYEQAAAPGGFTRVAGVDGNALVVASSLGIINTVTAIATLVPQPGVAMTVNLSAYTSIVVNRILVFNKVGVGLWRAAVTAVGAGGPGTGPITVVPLGLVGDTLGVNYVAGTVVTSPATTPGSIESWPLHQHGGTVASHQHNITHGHAKGAQVGINVAAETDGDQWNVQPTPGQTKLALPDHTHNAAVGIPVDDVITATAQAGTVDTASGPLPNTVSLPLVSAVAGTKQLATALIGMVDSATCPPGWVEYSQAAESIVATGAAGQGVTFPTAGHSHGLTFTAHAATHSHGGALTAAAGYNLVDGSSGTGPMFFITTGGLPGAVFGGRYQQSLGHQHSASLSGIQNVAATLLVKPAQVSSTADGLATRPPAFGLRFCRRA